MDQSLCNCSVSLYYTSIVWFYSIFVPFFVFSPFHSPPPYPEGPWKPEEEVEKEAFPAFAFFCLSLTSPPSFISNLFLSSQPQGSPTSTGSLPSIRDMVQCARPALACLCSRSVLRLCGLMGKMCLISFSVLQKIIQSKTRSSEQIELIIHFQRIWWAQRKYVRIQKSHTVGRKRI